MKQVLSVLCVFLLVLSMAGCDRGTPELEYSAFDLRISGSVNVGETATYIFEGEEGMSVLLSQLSGKGWVTFKLSDPNGLEVVSAYGRGGINNVIAGPVELKSTGDYTLTIEPDGSGAEFAFVLWYVNPVVIAGGSISFNQEYAGRTLIPGQIVEYTFEGSPTQYILLNQLEGNAWNHFRLFGPNGEEVFSKLGYEGDLVSVGPVELSHGGTYTLVVDPFEDAILDYKFVLWQIDVTFIDGGEIESGVPVSGSNKVAGQSVDYYFDGVKGQRVTFTQLSGNTWMYFKLFGADAMKIFEKMGYGVNMASATGIVLDHDGEYTLVVYGHDPADLLEFEFIMTFEIPED